MAQWRLLTSDDYGTLFDGKDNAFTRSAADQDALQSLQLTASRLSYRRRPGEENKLPRVNRWRPYRLTMDDLIVAATTLRHHKQRGCVEVGVFLAADAKGRCRGASLNALVLFLLSEAYKASGSFSLQFVRTELREQNGELRAGATRPTSLPPVFGELMRQLGIELRGSRQGWVPDEAGCELYVRLTGFDPTAEQRLRDFDRHGVLSARRVCHLIHRGVWRRTEMESILLGAPYPDAVLSPELVADQRHLHQFALFHGRNALLGGMLDNWLCRVTHVKDGRAVIRDDERRDVSIGFDGDAWLKVYRSPRQKLVLPPWGDYVSGQSEIPPGQSLGVLVRARNASQMALLCEQDLDSLQQLPQQPDHAAVLYGFDFMDLPYDSRENLVEFWTAEDVRILVAPDPVSTLDSEAQRRIEFGRIVPE